MQEINFDLSICLVNSPAPPHAGLNPTYRVRLLFSIKQNKLLPPLKTVKKKMKLHDLLLSTTLYLAASVRSFNSTGMTVLSVASGSASGRSADSSTWSDSRILAPFASISPSSSSASFDVASYISTTKINHFNLGYITGDSQGNPKWDGKDPILTDIYVDFVRKTRSSGGDVVFSFGGSNGELLVLSSLPTRSTTSLSNCLLEI